MALLRLEAMKGGGPLATVIQTLSGHRQRTESDPIRTSGARDPTAATSIQIDSGQSIGLTGTPVAG
jgi:hypothetical protein